MLVQGFSRVVCYYTTLARELTHWTQREQRLNRDFAGSAGGMKATQTKILWRTRICFVCADLELHQQTCEENAANIATCG